RRAKAAEEQLEAEKQEKEAEARRAKAAEKQLDVEKRRADAAEAEIARLRALWEK
ncbi:MAG: Uma2 family endonuclease, partial [Gammaproteobacteria bacterium]|nr:Uma2 family endonuclease [Gammaproteobacteria bacterium]